MANDALKELYIDELKDLYNAETQLVKALPKMAKAATSDQLRQGFEEHLEQTKEHVQRLEKIFQELHLALLAPHIRKSVDHGWCGPPNGARTHGTQDYTNDR